MQWQNSRESTPDNEEDAQEPFIFEPQLENLLEK
jgi:hypothetical protein